MLNPKGIFLLLFTISSIAFVSSCDLISPETAPKQPVRTLVKKAKSLMKAKTKAAYKRYAEHRYLHRNKKRAEKALSLIPKVSGIEKFKIVFQYATELLNSGDNKKAIAEFSKLAQLIEQDATGLTNANRSVFDMLAVAYLRLGEEQNCCANHNDESCLFPLKGKAIHTIPEGSLGAIKVYEKILSKFPDDIQSKYLMNVAYMTLGKYPTGVPKNYLLEGLDASSEVTFPRFPDIAIKSKSDIIGLSGGVCLEDFNGDQKLDIICSSYGLEDQLQYLVNSGTNGFTDVTDEAGFSGITSGLNMVHADYDNDGDNDILLLRGAWLGEVGMHPNSLLKNNGEGTFTDATIEAGLYSEHPTQNACWADFNNDGWLDVFIGNENKRNNELKHPCELYLNMKDGSFKEVAISSGVQSLIFAKGSCATDYDSDGLTDIFVSNLYGANLLYKNLGNDEQGIPHFENVAASAGVEYPEYSFGCWFFDYDNDGHQDLFVADYDVREFSNVAAVFARHMTGIKSSSEKPKLYRNLGNGKFEDVTIKSGLNRSTFAMGCNFGDLNNDGFLDFYLGNGAPDFRMIIPNLMFLNQSGKKFIDVTNAGRFGNLQKGHAVGFGDVDNDGDQDVYAVMGGAVEGDSYQNLLFQNPGWDNKWIQLFLAGTKSNRSAIGAKVRITVSGEEGTRSIHRRVGTGGSFGSSSLRLEIGLGNCEKINQVSVNWPNGEQEWIDVEGVTLNAAFNITEGENAALMFDLPKVNF